MPAASLERKQLPLAAFTFTNPEAGTFGGYASVFDGVDAYGDTIVKGAYAATIPKFLADGFIAWGHNDLIPVAYPVKAREDEHGLYIEAQFHGTPAAQEARQIAAERLAAGKRMGLSIGYYPVKAESGPDGTRILRQIDLVETSLVMVPADDAARVAEVKAAVTTAVVQEHLTAMRALLADLPADVADPCRTALDAMGKMLDRGMALSMLGPQLDAIRKLLSDMPAATAQEMRTHLDALAAMKAAGPFAVKGAVGVHHTATSTGAWDGPANTTRVKTDQDAAYYRKIFAWQEDGADPALKTSWRFIHHEVSGDGTPGAANMKACSTLIGVLNGGRGVDVSAQPWSKDRAAIHAHIAAHMKDGGQDAPPLKSLADLDRKYLGGMGMMGDPDPAPGSYEALADAIEDAYEDAYLTGGGCACVVATFRDYAIVAVMPAMGMPMDMGDGPDYYRVPYTAAANGDVTLGTPTPVEAQLQYVAAADRRLRERRAAEAGLCGVRSPWAAHLQVVLDTLTTGTHELEAFYVRALAQDHLETKEGRRLSAETRAQLQQVVDSEDSLRSAFAVIRQLLAETEPPAKGLGRELELREIESRLRLAGIVPISA
jgi:HK97 family phage prohead protease